VTKRKRILLNSEDNEGILLEVERKKLKRLKENSKRGNKMYKKKKKKKKLQIARFGDLDLRYVTIMKPKK